VVVIGPKGGQPIACFGSCPSRSGGKAPLCDAVRSDTGNSMKGSRTKFRIVFLCAYFFLLSHQTVRAFYNESAGRWLSRDRIEEAGGKNVYAFVRNRSTGHFDGLGLYPITSFYICWPSCNGKTYNPQAQCCCGGKVYNDKPVDTGVAAHNFAPSGVTASLYGHQWITWPGGSAGYNVYNGQTVVTPDPYAGGLPPVAGAYTSTPIKLSPCRYNISEFVNCVSSAAIPWVPPSATSDCGTFVDDVIATCQKASKGCGL
jgi:hypothetical protein